MEPTLYTCEGATTEALAALRTAYISLASTRRDAIAEAARQSRKGR